MPLSFWLKKLRVLKRKYLTTPMQSWVHAVTKYRKPSRVFSTLRPRNAFGFVPPIQTISKTPFSVEGLNTQS